MQNDVTTSASALPPEAMIALVLVLAIPTLLFARFLIFMILPRSWLKKAYGSKQAKKGSKSKRR